MNNRIKNDELERETFFIDFSFSTVDLFSVCFILNKFNSKTNFCLLKSNISMNKWKWSIRSTNCFSHSIHFDLFMTKKREKRKDKKRRSSTNRIDQCKQNETQRFIQLWFSSIWQRFDEFSSRNESKEKKNQFESNVKRNSFNDDDTRRHSGRKSKSFNWSICVSRFPSNDQNKNNYYSNLTTSFLIENWRKTIIFNVPQDLWIVICLILSRNSTKSTKYFRFSLFDSDRNSINNYSSIIFFIDEICRWLKISFERSTWWETKRFQNDSVVNSSESNSNVFNLNEEQTIDFRFHFDHLLKKIFEIFIDVSSSSDLIEKLFD